jgi:hypothetical protein
VSPPTWSVGQVLAAADVNTWFVPRAAYKTSAQHSTTTTLANDTQLALPVDANAIYDWKLYLFYDGGTLGSGDLAFNFTFPTGLAAAFQILGYNAASNDVERLGWQLPLGSNTIIGTEGLGNLRSATVTGSVDTAAAGGTLQLQWARSSNASGVDTIVHVGSYMTLWRIG